MVIFQTLPQYKVFLVYGNDLETYLNSMHCNLPEYELKFIFQEDTQYRLIFELKVNYGQKEDSNS